VTFEPGTLTALGKNKGQVRAEQELRTAGKPARLALIVERARLTPAWDDVCYVDVAVLDRQGVLVPSANDFVHFKISGPGVIAAVDSGDNSSHEPFQASERRAWQGRCVAILRASGPSGKIKLTASATGLSSATATIEAAPIGAPR
jgi:beta-galactosidase